MDRLAYDYKTGPGLEPRNGWRIFPFPVRSGQFHAEQRPLSTDGRGYPHFLTHTAKAALQLQVDTWPPLHRLHALCLMARIRQPPCLTTSYSPPTDLIFRLILMKLDQIFSCHHPLGRNVYPYLPCTLLASQSAPAMSSVLPAHRLR